MLHLCKHTGGTAGRSVEIPKKERKKKEKERKKEVEGMNRKEKRRRTRVGVALKVVEPWICLRGTDPFLKDYRYKLYISRVGRPGASWPPFCWMTGSSLEISIVGLTLNRVIAVSCLFDFVSAREERLAIDPFRSVRFFFFFLSFFLSFFRGGYSIYRPLVTSRGVGRGRGWISRVKYDPLAGCYDFFSSPPVSGSRGRPFFRGGFKVSFF